FIHLCGTPVDSVTRAATVRVWTAGHHCVSFQDMVTAFSKVLASSATRSSYVRRPCRTEIFTGSHCSVFENRARSAVQCEPGAHRQWLAARTRSLGAPAHYPGDIALIEDHGYPGARIALQAAGAKLASL